MTFAGFTLTSLSPQTIRAGAVLTLVTACLGFGGSHREPSSMHPHIHTLVTREAFTPEGDFLHRPPGMSNGEPYGKFRLTLYKEGATIAYDA
jgi:hypothetical protein